jgi:hypothetical protein
MVSSFSASEEVIGYIDMLTVAGWLPLITP